MITTTLLAPILGGAIGYVTNDIAIRMLFRPHKPKYLFGMHIPFTPGIIPKEKGRIACAMGEAISENLMNKEVLERTLLSDDLLSKISSTIDNFCEKQSRNGETFRCFCKKFLSDDEIERLTNSAAGEFERLLADKLSHSAFGDDIAHLAINHAMGKVSDGVLGIFGADKFLSPVAAIAEPLLAKEINKMLQNNSQDIIHKLVSEQSDEFINTPMSTFFSGHEEQIQQVKDIVLSVYHTVIIDHLPRMLAALDISHMIEQRINEMDMNEIEPIILQVMAKELKAIVWFGAGLGALIGCVNILF